MYCDRGQCIYPIACQRAGGCKAIEFAKQAAAPVLSKSKLHQIHETRRQFLINCANFNRQQLQDQMRFARESVADAGPLDGWAERTLVSLVDMIGQFRFGPTWESDGR